MKSIEFLGASGDEVTGSSYLITGEDNEQIMVDFGLFQGKPEIVNKNYSPLSFNASGLKAVFVTHAHLDHSGRLPLLIYGGFKGKVYMTAPTKRLVEIILEDSAKIAEADTTKTPLYTLDEVWKILNKIEVIEYEREITTGNFKIVFKDAGHILGSSSILVSETTDRGVEVIAFSGDLGNTPQPLVNPTTYIEKADYVVMESTYGDSLHPKENIEKIFQEEINTIEEPGGTLLIPAFAIERTQEVLHIIHHLKEEGKIKPETLVFLDSPMGINATTSYLDFKSFQNDEIQKHPTIPFNFEGLLITYEGWESRKIQKETGPKVIIAGSGMMSGGRITHHLINYLADESTRILIVGYQAEETIGRQILDKAPVVVLEDRKKKRSIPVKAHIREIKTLSSHADQKKLLDWLKHIQGVKKVFLTHVEKTQRESLAQKIREELKIDEVYLPKPEEIFELALQK